MQERCTSDEVRTAGGSEGVPSRVSPPGSSARVPAHYASGTTQSPSRPQSGELCGALRPSTKSGESGLGVGRCAGGPLAIPSPCDAAALAVRPHGQSAGLECGAGFGTGYHARPGSAPSLEPSDAAVTLTLQLSCAGAGPRSPPASLAEPMPAGPKNPGTPARLPGAVHEPAAGPKNPGTPADLPGAVLEPAAGPRNPGTPAELPGAVPEPAAAGECPARPLLSKAHGGPPRLSGQGTDPNPDPKLYPRGWRAPEQPALVRAGPGEEGDVPSVGRPAKPFALSKAEAEVRDALLAKLPCGADATAGDCNEEPSL